MITEILTFLFVEEEEYRAEPYSVVLAIIFLILGVIVTGYLFFKIKRNVDQLEEIKEVLIPVYYMLMILTLRYIVSLIDFLLWYRSDGDESLNGYYESMLWFLLMWQFYIIISDQNLIQISRTRVERYNLILKVIKGFLIFGVITLIIVNFASDSIVFEMFFWIIWFSYSILIFRILNIEINNMTSKINKIRLKYLYRLWYYFLIYFLSIIIGYGLMPTLFKDGNINGIYFTVFASFMNLSPIMMSFSLYWAVFIPDKARKEFGISNPKNFE